MQLLWFWGRKEGKLKETSPFKAVEMLKIQCSWSRLGESARSCTSIVDKMWRSKKPCWCPDVSFSQKVVCSHGRWTWKLLGGEHMLFWKWTAVSFSSLFLWLLCFLFFFFLILLFCQSGLFFSVTNLCFISYNYLAPTQI